MSEGTGNGEEGTAKVGHNSGVIEYTEKQRQALFFHHVGLTRKGKEAVKDATKSLRDTLNSAKAAGVSKKDIDFALVLDEDEGEMIEQWLRQNRIAQWHGHPIGTQFSWLDQQPDRTPLLERAYAAGERAGMEGLTPHSPHDGEAGQRWMQGWHDGQMHLMSALDLTKAGVATIAAEAAAEADKPKKARGRPKKTAEPPTPAKSMKEQLRDAQTTH